MDGASGQSLKNIQVLESIADNTSLIVDFGGGIKRTEDVEAVFDAGASMISVGSVAVNQPDLFAQWIIDFGAEKFLPGADVLDKKIKIHGWKEDTGLHIFDFIQSLLHLGIKTIFCTDISKDGMMQGPSTELYKEILKEFPLLNLIASGGISCYEDLFVLRKQVVQVQSLAKHFMKEKLQHNKWRNF